MSKCNEEVFTQEAGLICKKSIDNTLLREENKKLRELISGYCCCGSMPVTSLTKCIFCIDIEELDE